MTHWHDTPAFDAAVEDTFAAAKAADKSRAQKRCDHLGRSGAEAPSVVFESRRTGTPWLLCEPCARSAIILDLLRRDHQPCLHGASDTPAAGRPDAPEDVS